MKRQQKQIQLTAHDKILIFDSLRHLLEGLEEYIEKSGYYPNFRSKRQLRNVTIPKRKAERLTVDDAEDFFKTNLMLFVSEMRDTPEYMRKGELKDELYKWINAVGIDIDNCHDEKLKHFLIEIENVLEGNDEKIIKQTEEYLDNKDRGNPYPTNPQDTLTLFGDVQGAMRKERQRAKLYEGKTDRDVKVEKFNADVNQGKQTFNQFTSSVASEHKGFSFYPQKTQQGVHPTNLREVVQEVKTNPQNWRLDEITTEINRLGWAKEQKLAVYCGHARLDDYNQEGKLNFNNNPIHLWENFSSQQRFEIKQAKNISGDYLTSDEIKWVVEEVKNNPRVWRIGEIDKQIYLIHNSAQIKNNEIGTLIHSRQKFNETKWAEINGALERVKLIDNIKQNTKLEIGIVVFDLESGKYSEADDWFVHNEWKNTNEAGCLIFNSEAMVRAKGLTEAEQKEVGYKLETSQQVQTSRDNHPQGRGGGFGSTAMWGSFTVISLIGLAFTR